MKNILSKPNEKIPNNKCSYGIYLAVELDWWGGKRRLYILYASVLFDLACVTFTV